MRAARLIPLLVLALVARRADAQRADAQHADAQHAAVAPRQVQAGVAVRPDTVTVGQHFTAVVRVRVPAGAKVDFPAAPDSASQLDTAGHTTRADNATSGVLDITTTYVLAAWDTGALLLGLDSIVLHAPTGDRLVPVGGGVYVRSVLPLDSAQRVPKPPRPAIPVTHFDWRPWAIAAAIAALVLLAWYFWRRWRRRVTAPITPAEWAAREFARVESAGWLDGGQQDRYAAAMTDVLRGYLARAIPGVVRSDTTRELATALREKPAVPADRVLTLLDRVDLVKFAAVHLSVDEARAIGAEARQIVADVETALAAERERAAAAAAAAARKPEKAA